MACMHKETFKIYHNDQNMLPEGYADIDELIAPTIQVLNQKGYITRFCCSGHPFNIWLMEGDEDDCQETAVPLNSYIAFAEGITLPSLPPDFVKEQSVGNSRSLIIRKWYKINNDSDNQFFEKAKKILKTMEQLYQWALDLPDFENK